MDNIELELVVLIQAMIISERAVSTVFSSVKLNLFGVNCPRNSLVPITTLDHNIQAGKNPNSVSFNTSSQFVLV